MAMIKEDPDHLTHLANEFRKLARRTDLARQTAIGASDFGSGNAHDPALNEQIDWFYRRWVQQVEEAKQYMLAEADLLERARETYKLTEGKVQRSAEPQQARRKGADL